tara:strand:+ start:1233 stop:1385 length:153 start_codon:yes stop_codon:yes gene_type:complete
MVKLVKSFIAMFLSGANEDEVRDTAPSGYSESQIDDAIKSAKQNMGGFDS